MNGGDGESKNAYAPIACLCSGQRSRKIFAHPGVKCWKEFRKGGENHERAKEQTRVDSVFRSRNGDDADGKNQQAYGLGVLCRVGHYRLKCGGGNHLVMPK